MMATKMFSDHSIKCRLKNEASMFSQTVRSFNMQHRLLLTGTPLQVCVGCGARTYFACASNIWLVCFALAPSCTLPVAASLVYVSPYIPHEVSSWMFRLMTTSLLLLF